MEELTTYLYKLSGEFESKLLREGRQRLLAAGYDAPTDWLTFEPKKATCKVARLPDGTLLRTLEREAEDIPTLKRLAGEIRAAVMKLQYLPTGPIEAPKPQSKTENGCLSKEEKALAALVGHPEWSDAQIAEHVGCSRTSLYRWQWLCVAARVVLESSRENVPRANQLKWSKLGMRHFRRHFFS